VVHIKGENNNVADWLSRSIDDQEDELLAKIYVPEVYHLVHEMGSDFVLPNPEEFAAEARREEAELPAGTLDWYNNVPYGRRIKRIYVPERYRMQILTWFHMSKYGGHQGVTRTTNRLRKYVWWPDMQKAVNDFIMACPLCNAIKPIKSTGGIAGILSRPGLFQLVSMDYIGPRTYGNKKVYILVIVDHYSRFMVTIVLTSIEAPKPRNALRDHWVAKFGAPLAILCDRDPTFTAELFKLYVTTDLKSNLHYTSREYPQGNGINESAHRILETALKTYPWRIDTNVEDVVGYATTLYNVTPNRTIGDTPSSLTFGMDIHLPGLEDFEPQPTEGARMAQLRNFRGAKILLTQLDEFEENSSSTVQKSTPKDFKQGDIVTYQLTSWESSKTPHVTQEKKYQAKRSFPQRVTRVTPTNVHMVPLWTAGKERVAPKEQCRIITTFIPELLREEVRNLYPTLPWLTSGNSKSEQKNPKKRKRLYEAEASEPSEKRRASQFGFRSTDPGA